MSLRTVGGAALRGRCPAEPTVPRALRCFLHCRGHWFTIRELSDHLDIGSDTFPNWAVGVSVERWLSGPLGERGVG